MRILLVSPTVCPIEDANANCSWQVARGLAAQGHQIHILQQSTYPSQRAMKSVEGIPIHSFYMPGQISVRDLETQLRHNPVLGVWLAFHKLVAKLTEKYDNELLLRLSWLKPLRKSILRECAAQRFDAILCTFFPVESAYILKQLKEAGEITVPYYLYQLDEYVDNPGHNPAHRPQRLANMQGIYLSSGGAALTLLQVDHACAYVPSMSDRFIALHFPLVVKKKPPVPERHLLVEQAINCVYIGSLYPEIREPDYMLSLFEQLQDERIHVHLLVGNKYAFQNLERWQRSFGNRLHITYIVPAEECAYIMQHSDVLINVGNATTRQIPSKVLDYISTGRPILNISKVAGCTSLLYLQNYPKALNLLEDPSQIHDQAAALKEFVEKEAGMPALPFSTIESLYQECTPAYVAGALVRLMSGAEKEEER